MLDGNTWKHLMNRIISDNQQYFKPFNCVQKHD